MNSNSPQVILLVEDEVLIAMSEEIALKEFGYKVITVYSGENAVETIKNKPEIDLVLMDIDLGGGIDGTVAAKQILIEKDIPIIFLSSHMEPEVVEKTEKITAYGYVVKNSNITVIDASIKMAFKLFDAYKHTAESEETYRMLYKSINDALFTSELGDDGTLGKFILVNEIACQRLGYSREELLSKTPFDINSEKSRQSLTSRIKKIIELKHVTVESEHVTKDGKIIPIELSTNVAKLRNRIYFHSIARDISERKQAQNEIKAKNEELESLNEELTASMEEMETANELLIVSNEELMIKDKLLATSEIRYRRLFESAKDGILILDAETGMIMVVNPFLIEMLGYSQDQFLKKTIWEIGFFKDVVANQDKFMELQQKEYVRYENLPLRTADGQQIHVEFVSNVYLVDNQKVIQCNIRDITDRIHAADLIKTLYAEKELVLKEVLHRVKNNMNTLHSLLVLQTMNTEDPAAVAALKDAAIRVQSMMVLHDKISRTSSLNNISVANYLPSLIDEIISNFPNSKMVKVVKKIDDFVINAKMLQPFGIIINELLTNIMKYAFTGRKDGIITVSASLKGNNLSVIIADNGNGMPEAVDFENSTGFGLSLVKMMTDQLAGSIRIERRNGTSIILEFGI